MKSTTLILLAVFAFAAVNAQKGGYNRAALASANRSPVNVGRKSPPAPPPVQQVQQKNTDEEEDESALLAAQRRRPQPAPAPAPAPAPVAPAPRPAPRPAPAPYRPPAPRPVAPAPRPAPQALAPQRPRPAPPAPAPVEAEEGGHPAPEPYSFSYSVNDEQTGAALQREESQDAAGNIVGFYHISDADGRLRRVDYTAGPEGFKANIRSNEEGLEARDPADAHYEIEAPSAAQQASAAAQARGAASKPAYAAVAGNRY